MRHAPSVRANDWEDIADTSRMLGVELDEWQEGVLQAAMGVRSDGTWAARYVGVSAPRQQGKSQLIVARALAGVLYFGEQTVIISAHQQDTAREVFQRIVDLIDTSPELARRVDSVMRALNREFVRFTGGQTIRFKARSVGGGRGFSCDCLLLDEAQILGTAAWSAISPTMSARPNPQAWLLGTPPTAGDDGEVFGRFRDSGIDGKEARLAYLEWSADVGDDLDDPETWAKANPAYGSRISHDAIAGERATMSDDQFAMERLGMWAGAGNDAVIDPVTWGQVADVESLAVDRLALAVDVDPDRTVASVALAGQRDDGLWHVELDEQRGGVGWLVSYVRQMLDANPKIRALVIDRASPAASLLSELDRERVRPTLTTAREYAAACGQFFDGVHEQWLRHIDQPQMNASLSAARKRPLGDAWAWNRSNSASDITPLVAATLALWGAQAAKPKRPAKRASSRGGRRTSGREAVVLG